MKVLRRLAAVSLTIASIIGVTVAASAVIPDGNGVIHGCYKKNGELRIVDGTTCPKPETPISWPANAGSLSDISDLNGLTCTTVDGPGIVAVKVGAKQAGSGGYYDYPITTSCQRKWPVEGTPCTDDGNPYTTDVFSEGACTHTPTPQDLDNDGWSATAAHGSTPDCDDTDPGRNPGQPELDDGFDNNCNGQIDEGL